MKKSELVSLIKEAISNSLKREDISGSLVTDEQLDDATQLLMMISGRVMSAKDKPVPSELMSKVIEQLEQIDGVLDKQGLSSASSLFEAKKFDLRALEFSLKGEYRDDPESPIKTLRTGLNQLAWKRIATGDAKAPELKKIIEQEVSEIRNAVASGKTFSYGNIDSLSSTKEVNPNHFKIFEFDVTKTSARGDKSKVLLLIWRRETNQWKKRNFNLQKSDWEESDL